MASYNGFDDSGSFSDKKIGLSSHQLSIIDDQEGYQPVNNEDEQIWIVYNGETFYIEKFSDCGLVFVNPHTNKPDKLHKKNIFKKDSYVGISLIVKSIYQNRFINLCKPLSSLIGLSDSHLKTYREVL